MFYKLVNKLTLPADSISATLGSISVSISSLFGYNARIAPSKKLRYTLEISSKIIST